MTRADRPAHVLDRLESALPFRAARPRHEIRDAGVDGRPEEAGREPGDEREERRSAPADVANGSARRRRRGGDRRATISFRRSSRSSSGPSVSPIDDRGRNSTMRTPPTQRPEFVRSLTSIASATAARSVPKLDPSVERKSRRKPATPRGASCLEGRREQSRLRVTGSSALVTRHPDKDMSERVREELVLLRRADGDADRARRAEAVRAGGRSRPAAAAARRARARRRPPHRRSCRAPGRPARGRGSRSVASSCGAAALRSASRRRASSPSSPMLASAAACAVAVTSNARRTLLVADDDVRPARSP